MSDVTTADSAIGRWGLIFHGSRTYVPAHTRQEWTWIADAIQVADRVMNDTTNGLADRVGQQAIRGDDEWCMAAVARYDSVRTASDYWHPDPATPIKCYADEQIIRAWLDAPWAPPGDHPHTMAEARGWDVLFEPDRPLNPLSLTILVDQAQKVGVFGAPNGRAELVHWVENGITRQDAHLVTVGQEVGPQRGSPMVGADRLIHPGRTPVDAMVSALQSVARVVDGLLAARDGHTKTPHATHDLGTGAEPRSPGVEGWSVNDRARPFPPLRLDNAASAAPDLPARPHPAPDPNRSR
jgi:hypothetical protein